MFDQAIDEALIRNVAVMIAVFYKELISKGVPPDHALVLSCAFIEASANQWKEA